MQPVAVGADCLKISGIVVLVVLIFVMNIKLTRVYCNKPTSLALCTLELSISPSLASNKSV